MDDSRRTQEFVQLDPAFSALIRSDRLTKTFASYRISIDDGGEFFTAQCIGCAAQVANAILDDGEEVCFEIVADEGKPAADLTRPHTCPTENPDDFIAELHRSMTEDTLGWRYGESAEQERQGYAQAERDEGRSAE